MADDNQMTRPLMQAESENMDRTVTPPVMVRGMMGKDTTWNYAKVDTKGSSNTVLRDVQGNDAKIAFSHTLATHEPVRLAGTTFVGATVDTNFWTVANNGAGSSVVQDGRSLILTSGTANDGYANLQSVESARFIFANPNLYRAALKVTDTTVADNTRRWGAYTSSGTPPDPQDGFYFELSPAGVLSINTAIGGVVTTVSSGSFNGDATTYTLDTNIHAYEIRYFLMKLHFLVDGILIHEIDTNDLTDLISSNYTLPIQATCVNSASGTTSGAITTFAAAILREGLASTQPKSAYQSGTTAGLILRRGAGLMHAIAIGGVVVNSAITLYDNTAASGTILWSTGAMPAQTQPFLVERSSSRLNLLLLCSALQARSPA